MDPIVGIDLGTTNSAVAIIRDGRPVVLPAADGQLIVPSVVGLNNERKVFVGQTARNQAILAPERTIKSIKRRMGENTRVKLGDDEYSPQEISAFILRTLKVQAEQALGQPVQRAVITVPAFFNETQREATREAGELAGLEVVRIINEPTAASLVYEPRSDRHERLLVYDLGGGTFDVSIVQIEDGVIEVLSSHGDTHLGGDDFDQLLLDHVCDKFQEEHKIDLRQDPRARSRLLFAVEEAKKRLSFEGVTSLTEEFIAEQDGRPLHLNREIQRHEYERLIGPLLDKTIQCVDAALADAKLHAKDIDKIILVGGSSRTPMVHWLLERQLGQTPHQEVDPDLCVAMGAAVQGALIAGVDVGPVLVDITPHTLGIEVVEVSQMGRIPHMFSPIIPRNSPLPARRSDVYATGFDGQDRVEIHVLQGEHRDARQNHSIGKFMLEGLNEDAHEGNQILVRFDLDLDGILKVTAVERATSLERQLIIQNPIAQFRAKDRSDAKARLSALLPGEGAGERGDGIVGLLEESPAPLAGDQGPQGGFAAPVADSPFAGLVAKARKIRATAAPEDAEEIDELIRRLLSPEGDAEHRKHDAERLGDLLFYLEDA